MFGGVFNPNVPLLNEYKYGLCRRKLLRSLSGGPTVRVAPFFIHAIQTVIWFSPVLPAIPIVILDAFEVLNSYYLAIIYAAVMGGLVATAELILFIITYRYSSWNQRIQLDDESEEVYIASVYSLESISYVYDSRQKIDLILRPLVSAMISFVGVYILLPTVLMDMLPIPWIVVFIIVGWVVLCLTHYSVMVRHPPETAVYRATGPQILRWCYRPVYVLVVGIAIILVRELVTSNTNIYLYILYGSLFFLPFGWLVGLLPPIDALIPWIMEVILVRLFGGSPMATDLRLVISFSTTVIALAIGVGVRNSTASLLILTGFGFLLSQNIYVFSKSFLYKLSCICSSRLGNYIISKTHGVFSTTLQSYSGLGDVHKLNKFYVCLSCLGLIRNHAVLLFSLLIIHFTSTISVTTSSRRDYLARAMAIVWIIISGIVILNDGVQRVYFAGVIKNFLQPKLSHDLEKYRQIKCGTRVCSIPRKIIVMYMAPLLAVAFIGVVMGPISSSIIQRLAIARLLRKIWQNMESVLVELAVTSVVILVTGHEVSVGFSVLTLIIGVSLDIVVDFLQKLVFSAKLVFTYYTLHKQRSYTCISICIFICNFIFAPLLIIILIISSILAAPLLPIFSLPILLLGFPRTQRFWPSLTNYGSVAVKTSDSIYYQEVQLELGAVLYHSISSGAISSKAGTQILFRFENRLGLITILQKDYASCTINLRGLEFQETSCHSEEATKIDVMFEKAHTNTILNKAVQSTLTPADAGVIKAYSDAHNILTGIIDQPEALRKFSSNLAKTIVWVFYHHIMKNTPKSPCSNITEHFVVGSNNSDNLKPNTVNTDITLDTQCTPVQQFTTLDRTINFGGEQQGNVISTRFLHEETKYETKQSSDSSLEKDLETIPSMLEISESVHSVMSKSTREIRQPRRVKVHPFSPSHFSDEMDSLEVFDRGLHNTESSTTKGSSTHMEVEIARDTRIFEAALPQKEVKALLQERGSPPHQFPSEWYTYLTDKYRDLSNSDYNSLQDLVDDSFNLLHLSSLNWSLQANTSVTPQQIAQGFQGSFPQKAGSNWMSKESEKMKLSLKAYRYAVKLMYDEACLGEVESLEELFSYLNDYDNNWCIVSEKEAEWNNAILSKYPYLFSMDYNPEEHKYTAHVLSLKDTAVHFGTMNSAALQALWANMSFELFYLTNDDDERYSIQAHPYMLRNISSQLCDPPLGYCVYSSGLLTIPST